MSRLRRFLSCLAIILMPWPVAGQAEIPVGGQVLGPDGRGLGGIPVGLEPIAPNYERLAIRLGGEVGPGPEAAAVTDADGYFELLAPRLGAWKVVVPWGNDGEVTPARPPGYVTRERILRPLSEMIELSPVVLAPASVIEIRVVGEDGAPLDARLGLSDRRRTRDGWRTRLRLARTGDDGTARLLRGADEEPQLEVLVPSHPLVLFSGDQLPSSDEAIELRLPAGGLPATLRVTDRQGREIADAIAYQGTGILPLGRTDESGRLRLVVAAPEHEPPGITVLTDDGYRGHVTAEPRVTPEETHELVVAVEPLRRVLGRVIDLESRAGVADALVWGPNGQVTVSGPHGDYELRLFPSPRVMVFATAPGYARTYEKKALEDADSEDGPTLTLAPAALVGGTVVDSEDRPIASVDVTIKPADERVAYTSPAFRFGPRQTRSTRLGRFRISGLPPSASYELRFRKPGFAPREERIEGLAAFEERSGLRVVLDVGVDAGGWVVDEGEAPVAGASVRLVPVQPGDPTTRGSRRRPGDETGDEHPNARTDSEGRYQLANLAAGRYNLEVEAPGFTPASLPGLTVDAAAGEVDFGTVVLAPGARIAGTVRDSQGARIADAEIYLGDERVRIYRGRTEPRTRSDGQGRFAVDELRAGKSYRLVVTKSGYSSEAIQAVAHDDTTVNDTMFDVVLRPAGAVSGHVRNEDGEPVAGAHVSAQAMRPYVFDSTPRPERTDEEGAFRLDGVEPGSVRLWAFAEGYQRYEQQGLEVPARGEASGLEIVLVRGARVVGTVTRSDGTPVAQAVVSYSPARADIRFGGYQTDVASDRAGRYQLDGVEPGPAVIGVRIGGDRPLVSKNVELRPGTQTVDLVLEDGFEITGWVRDASGLPVAGAALTLTHVEGDHARFSGTSQPRATGSDGTFTLTDVAAGHYLLAASKEGYAPASTPEPFEVGRGPTAVIDLELRRGATLRGQILGLELDDLARVVVEAYGSTVMGASLSGLVDYEGRYSIPDLGPGTWHVNARIEASGRQAMGQVRVEDGVSEVELDLEFKSGSSVAGVVRSAGEPKGGVHVYASGMEPGLGHAQAVTGSDGRFRLDHLPAGRYQLRVMSRTGGGIPHSQELEVPTGEDVLIDLGTVRISGFVRDEVGERPIPGVAVQLERLDPDPSEPFSVMPRHTGVRTDSRGYFSLDVGPGTWRVIATKAGYGPADVTVDPNAGGPWGDLELRLSQTDGISFDVVLDAGRLPSQARAVVFTPGGRMIFQGPLPVDEAGTARISTVPAGTVELLVQAEDSAVVRTVITAPGHVGQVRLPRGANLRIRVPALQGVEHQVFRREDLVQVRLSGPEGRPHLMMENFSNLMDRWPMWNGEAMISRLTSGFWRFTIEHPDGRSWSGEAAVVAGEMSEVVVP